MGSSGAALALSQRYPIAFLLSLSAMDASSALRSARKRAHLSQRELARLTGIAQPTIARIESGISDPRLDTFDELLKACGEELYCSKRPGYGVDRTQLRAMLTLSARERLDLLVDDVRGWDKLVAARV